MDFFTVFTASLFALTALAIILYLLGIIFKAFGFIDPINSLKSFFSPEKLLLKFNVVNKEKALNEAEQLIKAGNLDAACVKLKESLYLEKGNFKLSTLEFSGSHNLNLLSKMLTHAEDKNGHLPNIALVEGLISSRNEMIRAFIDIKGTLNKIKEKKRQSKNQNAKPDWASGEFEKKLSDLQSKLDANYTALNSEFDKLISSLKNLSASSEITYH